MEHNKTMNDLMRQTQQKIEQFKVEAIEKQQALIQSLHEQIAKSREIQATLQQSQQQLMAQMEYGAAVLMDLEQGLQLDFSAEIAEFEQAYQNENADKEALAQHLEQSTQEKIALQLNELKAKTNVALQELGLVRQNIQQLFREENAAKINRLAKLKRHFYRRFGKQLIASKECLAKQLELGAAKLRA
ncbi:hypothetical protein [Rodentibacter heidelbergensis]|uniref:Uncharacterized protein n=1 Tax=Rodentibacter heidelbergensis TaxID=1908258 RepID=A0A1V3IC53_9PAST|nr:hypothetical protein [Rodentibacter heidelbergensis]OOF37347.1 hypothetical protein BKK48_01895 [Rodentibacter heidelbergensis]